MADLSRAGFTAVLKEAELHIKYIQFLNPNYFWYTLYIEIDTDLTEDFDKHTHLNWNFKFTGRQLQNCEVKELSFWIIALHILSGFL